MTWVGDYKRSGILNEIAKLNMDTYAVDGVPSKDNSGEFMIGLPKKQNKYLAGIWFIKKIT